MLKPLLVLALLMLTGVLAGCPQPPAGASAPSQALASEKKLQEARRLNEQATRNIAEGNLEEAQRKLEAAIEMDPSFGPAHNNLGILFFRQERFHQAAWEFRAAARLLPDKVQPRNNEGRVFEGVGKLTEALKSYDEAHKLEPANPEIAANLARMMLLTGRREPRLRALLELVAATDTRAKWQAWAREQLAMLPVTQPGR